MCSFCMASAALMVGGALSAGGLTALVVKEPTERASGVEPRQAAPVDRSPARDQRRGLAIADQAVVADRRVAVSVAHVLVTTRRDDNVRGPTPPVCPA